MIKYSVTCPSGKTTPFGGFLSDGNFRMHFGIVKPEHLISRGFFGECHIEIRRYIMVQKLSCFEFLEGWKYNKVTQRVITLFDIGNKDSLGEVEARYSAC